MMRERIVTRLSARFMALREIVEHEVMHEGQLIRHMCALEQPLPSSLKWA